MKNFVLSGSVLLVAAALVMAAEEKKENSSSAPASMAGGHAVQKAGELKWGEAPPGLPAGAKLAVLDGDPGKPGSFIVRLKMPAGYKIMPHTHPAAERVTVISGEAHIGMGEKFDESAGSTLKVGDFVALPKDMAHFAWSVSEVVVQIQSEGPFQIKYVNPADDPREAKK